MTNPPCHWSDHRRNRHAIPSIPVAVPSPTSASAEPFSLSVGGFDERSDPNEKNHLIDRLRIEGGIFIR
jgi:hypothetical protein